ncbi:MAG: thioredoxin domain-containing protein [Bacillota bacterium]|nr:thioredoxin domain-containing protein [Bacillota bacterium]
MQMLDKDTFENEVINASGYVLVDYFSDGCEPCKALMPSVEELSVEFEGKVKFYKLNTTKARRLAISQRVMGLPAILLYKDGVKVDELTKDDATRENIKVMIEKVL